MTNTVIKASVFLAISCALALMITLLSAEQAKTAELTEQAFQDTCFSPDFQGTDGCYAAAETLGIEIDNLNKSADLGCTLENMFEDYSCKGPQYKGYQPISEEPSGSSASTSSPSDKSAEYFLVDASNISQQDLKVFEANGYFGVAGDGAEQLYSPSYFAGKSISGLPQVTQQKILKSECYDVVGSSATKESATIEYIGCPSEAASVSAQEGTSGQSQGVTQQAPQHKAQTNPVAQRTAEIVAKSHAMLDAHPEFAPKKSSKAKK